MRSLAALTFASFLFATTAPAQNTLFAEDFESGYSNWTMTGLWNQQDDSEPCTHVAEPFPSGSHCAWYGSSTTCDFSDSDLGNHYLTCTTPIVLPTTNGVLELSFRSHGRAEEDGIWDVRQLEISSNGGPWVRTGDVFNSNALGMPVTPAWRTEVFDLTRFAGATVQLRLRFWAGDPLANSGIGWLVDDLQIVERDAPAIANCLGDGSWRECPCNNQGSIGRGCASSFNAAGARLSATGFASLGADTLLFTADGMSTAAATIIQSFHNWNSPYENLGGDGWMCMRGPYARIRTLAAPGGALSYPVGDVAISVRGGVTTPGSQRFYAVRYRNALSFCTSSSFNVTNGLSVTWRP